MATLRVPTQSPPSVHRWAGGRKRKAPAADSRRSRCAFAAPTTYTPLRTRQDSIGKAIHCSTTHRQGFSSRTSHIQARSTELPAHIHNNVMRDFPRTQLRDSSCRPRSQQATLLRVRTCGSASPTFTRGRLSFRSHYLTPPLGWLILRLPLESAQFRGLRERWSPTTVRRFLHLTLQRMVTWKVRQQRV